MAVGRGAVEFVVAGFAGPRIHPDVARGLREQVDRGVIRIIDLLFLQKDTEGLVRQFDLDGVGNDEAYAPFHGVARTIDGLVSPTDYREISEELPPDTTAVIVVFEHAWLRDMGAAVEARGGRLLFSERIPGDIVEAAEDAAERAASELT